MPTEIISALIQVVGGAIFGFIVAIFLEKTKIIESNVSSTEIVFPDELAPISIPTSKASSKKSQIPVKSAYNYTIDLLNVGRDDISKPDIDIKLDSQATIVNIEVQSDNIPRDKIEIPVEIRTPNYCRIIPQYVNKGASLKILITSINNQTKKCDLIVTGLGIIHRSKSSKGGAQFIRSALQNFLWIATILAIALAVLISVISQIAGTIGGLP